MTSKPFTKQNQKDLANNEYVKKCTEKNIYFTEEFALKVCEVMKKGGDVYAFFEQCDLPVKIIGKTRIDGICAHWKSFYDLKDLPRKARTPTKPKKVVPTSAERRQANLNKAIEYCEALFQNIDSLDLDERTTEDELPLACIKKTFEDLDNVIVKDLCAYYGYDYFTYYKYISKFKEKDEFVNILNPHRKK